MIPVVSFLHFLPVNKQTFLPYNNVCRTRVSELHLDHCKHRWVLHNLMLLSLSLADVDSCLASHILLAEIFK